MKLWFNLLVLVCYFYYLHESRLIFLLLLFGFRNLTSSFAEPNFVWMDDEVDEVSVFTVHVDCCRFRGDLEEIILVDVFSIPLPLMVTVSCVADSCSKSRLFAAAATARRSRLSAASCSRSSSSASLRYKSLNSSRVISERADFFEEAEPNRPALLKS